MMVFCFCIMCCFDTLMLDVHILPLLQYHHAHPLVARSRERRLWYDTLFFRSDIMELILLLHEQISILFLFLFV